MIYRTLVPLRFLSMFGHFLALVLFVLSRKDNVIVSLSFDYTSSEFDEADSQMVAASFLMLACFIIEAVGFFGGFSMFVAGLALLHITCHALGSILLSLLVWQKWHYVTVWYIFGFLSALPACCEIGAIVQVAGLKKKRW
uniref:Transmembrane protein 107 n=1 Tax=Chrysotila carterae TaxID=13221 RepID=A0A7S4EVZ3_CHRCT|mmetsp:Transcript_49380/g.106964  ORF Transcript_49380/g.106964 Transcript_49380/m.106964 type:complete len:140 (+) Transcript_49380:395-814(+)